MTGTYCDLYRPGHIWTILYNGVILNKNVSNSTILFP
jgi:hypothetical protein